MSDASVLDPGSQQPAGRPHEHGAAPSRARSPRERLREEIRAELSRAGAKDAARGSLELIVESAVRIVREDDRFVFRIYDEAGSPRRIERDGVGHDMRIADLVHELRATHPRLFQAPADAPAGKRASSPPDEAPSRSAADGRAPPRLFDTLERPPIDEGAPRGGSVRAEVAPAPHPSPGADRNQDMPAAAAQAGRPDRDWLLVDPGEGRRSRSSPLTARALDRLRGVMAAATSGIRTVAERRRLPRPAGPGDATHQIGRAHV